MRLYPLLLAILLLVGCGPEEKKTPDGKDTDGKQKQKQEYQSPPPPCHPGCFPAGTLVLTPEGPRAIETIRAGDRVTRIAADGTPVAEAVRSTFCTNNVLVELRTTAGAVLTTPTQPFALVSGPFRRSEELQPGDRIWMWANGRRAEAEVTSVADAHREAAVFNLVVGDSAVFVAGGFLAKGKPPLDAPGDAK